MLDVVGYEGLYSVTADGKIYSHHNNRYIALRKHQRGYLHVALYKNGVCKNTLVHRLVAEAYIGIAPNKAVANHKNFDRADNRVENLEWCTQQENVRHAILAGRRASGGGAKPTLTLDQAQEIRDRYSKGDIMQIELAKEYGIGPALTNLIINNKRYLMPVHSSV